MKGYVAAVLTAAAVGTDPVAAAAPCPATSEAAADALVRAACADLRLRLAKVPGGTVRVKSGTFLDERFNCAREGCMVQLSGRFSALRDEPPADEWLRDYLKGRGWSATLSHDADGPDGTTYAFHRPGALCIVEGRWNHWHEEGGAGHTEDPYSVTVSCGRAETAAPR